MEAASGSRAMSSCSGLSDDTRPAWKKGWLKWGGSIHYPEGTPPLADGTSGGRQVGESPRRAPTSVLCWPSPLEDVPAPSDLLAQENISRSSGIPWEIPPEGERIRKTLAWVLKWINETWERKNKDESDYYRIRDKFY